MNEIETLIAYWEKSLESSDRLGPFIIERIKETITALRQQQAGRGEAVAWKFEWMDESHIKGDWTVRLVKPSDNQMYRIRNLTPLYASPPPAKVCSDFNLFTYSPEELAAQRELTDEEIKYMVDRFLGWGLPEHFNPDCGISYKPDPRMSVQIHPVGTNLFSADQAKEMVRYMVDGMADRAQREGK